MVNRAVPSRLAAAALLCALTAACGGPDGRNVFDAFNSRDTGPYLPVSRAVGADGSLVVHVVAHRPEHAEAIARRIVRQNYATSARSVRVIVDPSGGTGDRHVYRSVGGDAVQADHSAEGLPPRPSAPSPSQH